MTSPTVPATPPDRSLRLMLIAPWLGGGGADSFNLDVCTALKGRGWSTTVVTLLNDRAVELDGFRAAADRVVIARATHSPVGDPEFVRRVIASHAPSVVLMSHSEEAYALLPYLRRYCPTPAYIDYCHIEEEHWRDGGHPRFSINHAPWLDLTLVSSEHLRRWMAARGGDARRIDVCTTNIDTGVWRPDRAVRGRVRAELGVGDSTPLILFAGRVCDQKQPRVLASTLLALASRGRNFAAVIAGEGEDAPWLRAFVNSNGLADRVSLVGAVPRAQVRALLQSADMFFLPSKHEGISVALFEAMACGAVPVSADVGGQRELVTPECGCLLPRSDEPGEARAYADCLDELIAAPARRASLASAAVARVRAAFDTSRLGDCITASFERAATLRASAPRRMPSATEALAAAARAAATGHVALLMDGIRRGQTGGSASARLIAIIAGGLKGLRGRSAPRSG